MSNYADWQEIVDRYTKLADEIDFVKFPEKPHKTEKETHAQFGARMDAYESDFDKVRQSIKQAGRKRQEFFDKLENEIFQWFKLDRNNPKVQKAWSIAYERGHSNGYNEVISYFEDLIELL
jgi:hypothetical protein